MSKDWSLRACVVRDVCLLVTLCGAWQRGGVAYGEISSNVELSSCVINGSDASQARAAALLVFIARQSVCVNAVHVRLIFMQ